MIAAAEQAPRYTDLDLADMGQNGQEKAVVLFNLLTQSAEGRALSVLMNVESGNGFAAWKALCEACEPDIGGRHTAMLTGIIAPAWESVKEGDRLPRGNGDLGSADSKIRGPEQRTGVRFHQDCSADETQPIFGEVSYEDGRFTDWDKL